MKVFLTAFAVAVYSTFAIAQTYNFKPNWKKGEVKNVTITTTEKEYNDGELVLDTVKYNDATIKVLDENKDSYSLEILYQNIALESAIELYARLGEEMKDYRNLKLLFNVNKETAKAELTNWKEAQDFMNMSFDKITEVFEEQAPEMKSLTGLIFAPIKKIFESKENTEAYMHENIGYLLVPFNKDFETGKTISETDSAQNPFNPRQDISATTNLTLKSVDEAKKTCIIERQVEMDLSEFKEMIRNMMMQMAKSFGVEDSMAASKMKEIDDIEMDMTNNQTIHFNYSSGWVTKVVTTANVISSVPGKGKKEKIQTSTTIIE